MQYLFFIILVAAQVSLAAAAQQTATLTGVVRDSTGGVMRDVRVSLKGSSGVTSATTGAIGEYRFDSIAPGSYEVTASRSGFLDAARSVLLAAGDPLQIDFTLEPTHAERTVVTASRFAQPLVTAPASVTVIGSREIEAAADENIANLLARVPGVNIAQFDARHIDINLRGASAVLSNSTLVMVDGRAFFQPFYGATYWDLLTINKTEISQIEVLRSPASALWGANALNGVINIRTKSPRQLQGIHGEAGLGERGTRSAAVTFADATDRLSYKLSGSYYEQDAWDRDNLLPNGAPMPREVLFENRGTKQPKMEARLDWDGDPQRLWSVRGGVAGANGLTHSALGPSEFSSGSYYSYAEVDRESRAFDVKAYWNRLESPYRITLFGLDEHATSDAYVGEVTRRQTVGARHSVTYGGSARLDRFDVSIAPDERNRVETAAFVEDTITAGAHVTAVAGGRLDKFDTTSAVFAPRVGVIVSPRPAQSLRFTYNRAYRAPTLLENFVDLSLPAAVPLDPPFYYFQRVLGSTDLKMERQDAFEIGYSAALNSRTAIFATVYDQTVKNNIWFFPTSFYGPWAPPPGWPSALPVPVLPQVFGFVNLGSVRDRGIELATTVEWPRLSINGTYTFQATPRQHDDQTVIPLTINRPARHQFGGSVTFTDSQWTVAGDMHFTDKAFWADVFTDLFWGTTPSFVATNVRVSYRIANRPWELWAAATDLLDEKIKSHVFGDTIRRKVTVGVRWQWTE
jgi:iron complex outermembrane receptor protein